VLGYPQFRYHEGWRLLLRPQPYGSAAIGLGKGVRLVSGAASRRSSRVPTNGRHSWSDRLLRWLHSTSRFGREIDKIVRQFCNTRSAKVAGDYGSSPNCYQQLVDSLDLPDRPELTTFERVLPGEASAIRTVARIAASTVIKNYSNVRKLHPAAKAMRDQHAKSHACLRARFVVNDNLPAGFETGVFKPKQTYDALVRFSNALGTRESDHRPDGRGMAIKLLNVKGQSILSTLVPDRPSGQQDFLMTNHPVFFCKGVADYLEFMETTFSPGDTLSARLPVQARIIGFFFPWRIRQGITFSATALHRIKSPLHATYHSMTPYLFGGDKVVRYKATPVRIPRAVFPALAQSRPESSLHDTLVAELDPAQHNPGEEEAVFEFSVQVRDAAKPDDVEDASRLWKQPRDQTISLGRIEIPFQSFDRPDQITTCEDLSFNPWNSLPEHRPLGGLNRMRLAVYLASMQVRHRLNA
jgi:hypothetical protein